MKPINSLKYYFISVIFFATINSSQAQIAITSVSPITSTTVGVYQKFEIGISTTPSTFSNPYDPNIINIWAVFTSPSGKTYTQYAFWYQPFIRNSSVPYPADAQMSLSGALPCGQPPMNPEYIDENSSYLVPTTTTLPWRVRFSNSEVGTWTYSVSAEVNNMPNTKVTSGNFTFNITATGDAKFISVGSNKRYFADQNGITFSPIGMNIVDWSNGFNTTTNKFVYNRTPYVETIDAIDRFANVGANLVRIWMNPATFGIEWNEDGLGVYNTRQNRAFDLDQIFQEAESKNVYIQLCLDQNWEFFTSPITSGTTTSEWSLNPYNTIASTPDNFFTSSTCQQEYEQKLRYIISRWDYSPNLFAYEMFNEVDQVGNFWSGGGATNVANWHNAVILYAKSNLGSRHMFTTSVTSACAGDFGLFSCPNIDLLEFHNYRKDLNVEYENNYLTKRTNHLYSNKPFFLGEFGISNDPPTTASYYAGSPYNFSAPIANTAYWYNNFHNTLWSTAVSGAAAPALYWDIHDVIYNSTICNSPWGGQETYFLPLNNFLQGEDLSSSNDVYSIANSCDPTGGPYDETTGIIRPAVYNPCVPLYSTEESTPNPLYIANTITTTDDKDIEIFALKKDDEVIGWVHNKNNYWYNLPHGPNNYSDPQFTSQPNNVSSIPTLTNKSVTITNLLCDGQYQIQFYSTYPQYDINNDGVPDNGGVIPSYTQTGIPVGCGNLTFTLPPMGALLARVHNSDPVLLPDYGFKITKMQDAWGHQTITSGSSEAAAGGAGTGAIAVGGNHVFYAGTDSRVHHLYPNGATNDDNSWAHVWLTDWSSDSQNINGDIVAGTNDIAYEGTDGRLHLYYYISSTNTWVHTWLTDWSSNSQNVSGHISMTSDGTVIAYQGIDNKIHLYSYDVSTGSWVHSTVWNSSSENISGGYIKISDNATEIFYGGADGRLHMYYKSGTSWNHIWLTDWSSSSQNIGGSIAISSVSNPDDHIFYKGADGNLHLYYWIAATNTWVHTLVESPSGATYAVNNQISASSDAGTVFFEGTDGYIHHLWGPVSNVYNSDDVICYNDLQTTYKSYGQNGIYVNNSDNVVKDFYIGVDNNIQVFFWNQGCFPRQNTAAMRLSNPDTTTESVNIVQQINGDSSVIVYPNPFDSYINIKMLNTSNTNCYAELYDVIGNKIKQVLLNSQQTTLATDNLQPGVYILYIKQNGETSKTFKVLKYK